MVKVQLLGQRCSGTNYLEQLIKTNLPDVEIWQRYGFKHCWNAKLGRSLDSEPVVPIIILVRNPYDWIRSLHRQPHHAPQLHGLRFSIFLRSPWHSYASDGWNHPVPKIRYERTHFDRQLESFSSIFEMRNQKNRLFLSVLESGHPVLVLKYEDFLQDLGGELFKISDFLGIKNPSRVTDIKAYKKTDLLFKPKPLVQMSASNLRLIRDSIDWEAEGLLGYSKQDYRYTTIFDYWYWRFRLKQFIYENLRMYT